MVIIDKNDYATFYVEATKYVVNKKHGRIDLLSKGSELGYYFKKKTYPSAVILWMQGQLGFKRGFKENFTETPGLLKQIEDGDLKKNDLYEIIALYLDETNHL